MRLLSSLLLSFSSGDDDYDSGYVDFATNIPYHFIKEKIKELGDLNYETFIASHPELNVGLASTLEEQYRVYKRECFLHNTCRVRKTQQRSLSRNANAWDSEGTCPDSVASDVWDYEDGVDVTIDDGRTVLLDRSVNVNNLIITNGGKLIFEDKGAGTDAQCLSMTP